MVDCHFQWLFQLPCRDNALGFVVSDEACMRGNLWVAFQQLEYPFLDLVPMIGRYLDFVIIDGVLGQANNKKVGSHYTGLTECPPARTFETKW